MAYPYSVQLEQTTLHSTHNIPDLGLRHHLICAHPSRILVSEGFRDVLVLEFDTCEEAIEGNLIAIEPS